MKTYKAYLIQEGEGCDYTIGCGRKVVDIEANDFEEAKRNLTQLIKEEFSHDELKLGHVELFEVDQSQTFTSLDLKKIYTERKADEKKARDLEREREEREEYERLKQKYDTA